MSEKQTPLAPGAGKAPGASGQVVAQTAQDDGTTRRRALVIEKVEPIHRLLAAEIKIRARRTSRGKVRISTADRLEALSSDLAQLRVQHLELERHVRTLEANLCAAVKALSESGLRSC